MDKMTFNEMLYFGFLTISLMIYLPLFMKHRREIPLSRRKSARWAIVSSYAAVGVICMLLHIISWQAALFFSTVACAGTYYVVFIKFKD